MREAHQVITAYGDGDVDLGRLATVMATPYIDGVSADRRLRLVEPMPKIRPELAPAVAMILQELFSNARKHGALSVPDGMVEIACICAEDADEKGGPCAGDQAMGILWRERGGPPAVEPADRGVGLDLIDGLARFDLSGACSFDFQPEGLVCRVRFGQARGVISHVNGVDEPRKSA